MPGALERRMLLVDPLLSQPRPCSSRTPAPGQRSPVASWRLLPSLPPLAAKVGSLAATLHHSTPLLLSLFLPDTQLLLCIWITFLCYGILVVFPIPLSFPLPFPVAGFLRKSFWRELQAHLLSGCSIPGGPCQGLRSQAARTRQAVEAGGWGAGPLALEARSGLTHCGRQGWASKPVGTEKVLEP